jgi:hypothetical protein
MAVNVPGSIPSHLIQLNNFIKNSGNDCIMSFMMNESLITRARNALAHNFLKTDCSHLMFIDADIRFNPADIPPMIRGRQGNHLRHLSQEGDQLAYRQGCAGQRRSGGSS